MGNENSLISSKVFDHVAVVWMDRKEALNALNPELFQSLLEALARHDADPEVHCVLLASEGKAFCVGADIKHIGTSQATDSEVVNYLKNFDAVAKVNKPLIALVNGAAFGGGFELALACDIVVASTKAIFAFPEIELGLLPGGGGTQRITRAIGKYRAMELILTNERVSAQDAEKLGIVNKVVEPDDLLNEGLRLGKLIASKRIEAVIAAKRAINASYDVDLESGLGLEKDLFAGLLNAADGKEGIKAFLEKRAPNWKSS